MNLSFLLASPVFVVLFRWTGLLALGWVTHGILRRRHTRWRLMLWRGILCFGLALPLLHSVQIPGLKIPIASKVDYATEPASAFSPVAAVDSIPPAQAVTEPVAEPQPISVTASPTINRLRAAPPSLPSKPVLWGRILLATWALGFAGGAARLVRLQLQLSRLRKETYPPSKNLQRLATQIQLRLKVYRKVEVRISDAVTSPFVCGLLKPAIILPRRLLQQLSSGEAAALLSHEMAHVRQRDLGWCVAWRWMQAACWFHPFVWNVPAAHNLACEQEADRIASRQLADQDSYIQLLARLALRVLALPAVETKLTLNGSSQIARRLKHLAQKGMEVWSWKHSVAGFGLMGTLFLMTAGCDFSKADTENSKIPTPAELKPAPAVVQDKTGKPDNAVLSPAIPAVANATASEAASPTTTAAADPGQSEALRPFAEDAVQKGAVAAAREPSSFDQSRLPPGLRYDTPPKPASTAFAVYPLELLRDGVSGTAEVRFLVSPRGRVEQAIVVKATRPEFGQAFLAMLDEWRFHPAVKDGKPVWAVLDISQEFSTSGGDVPVGGEARDLLNELKKENPALCPTKDLDIPPQLLSRHLPVFPSALVGKVAEGEVTVEFLIDHDGNVQLPRVVSATHPAFGYAAMQGASAWKFAPPTSHGKSVDVREQISIDFITPKPVATAGSIPVALADLNGLPVINLAELEQQPVIRFRPPINYPVKMRGNGVTGTVQVGFVCDTEGCVRDTHVVASSGSSELDQAAVEGISTWIFKPGRKDGHPVNVRMEVPITFDLNRT
jgi:TonB family protein